VLAAAVGLAVLAALAATLGPLPALALLLAGVGSLVLLIKPEVGTLLAAFLLYVNFPAILTKELGLHPLAAGAFILLLAFPLAHALVVRRERLRADAVFGLMVAFLAVLLLSSLSAVNLDLALDRVWQYVAEGLVLYWLVVNAVRDVGTLRKLFWVLLGAGALVASLSLYQEVTGSYGQEFGGLAHRRILLTEEGELARGAENRQRRAQGPVDEPNRFAQILIVLVPLAGYLVRTSRTPGLRLLAALLGLLAVVGAAMTLSRGGLLALALLAAAMALVRWIRPLHLAAGALVLLASGPLVSPYFLQRLVSIVDARFLFDRDAARFATDGAIRGRTTEMLAALHVFRDHPVLGVGPGQFPGYYFVDYARQASVKFRDIAVPRRAHNLYLEMGAELGALGLGAFLAMVGLVMRRLWRARRSWLARSRDAADLSTALWLSLLAYLTTAIFLHLSYQRYYWFLLALASVAVRLLGARPTAAAWVEREEHTWLRSRS
jgi:O-antigen ligase